MQQILVTGSNGMLGRRVVRKLVEAGYQVLGLSIEKEPVFSHENYEYRSMDLTRCLDVEALFESNRFSHVIHLAAIAHTYKGMDDSWSQYYRINTLCSKTLFNYAGKFSIPVFLASTVDVYGITGGETDESTEPRPIGAYACSKKLAEDSLKEICGNSSYLIARFAPIYTDDNRKDIQKRFYVKYPDVCYLIGNGREYEFLAVDNAVNLIADWVRNPDATRKVINVSDNIRQNTKELISCERKNGLAKRVIHIPGWMADMIYGCVKTCFAGKPFLVFTISKVLNPIHLKKE